MKMSRNEDDVVHRIRQELATSPVPAETFDEIWRKVVLEEAAPPRATRLRPSRSRRVLLFAAVASLVAGGSAAAGQTGALDGIFRDDAPATKQIDQLTNPAGERATEEEYDYIRGLLEVPARAKSDLPSALASRDESRVIVDDERVGRVVSVPTRDGAVSCLLHAPPSGASVGGCAVRFSELGLLAASKTARIEPTLAASKFYGIASDDVDRIAAELDDGTIVPISLVENAFYWEATTSRPAVAIHTWRGDRHEVRGIREA